MVPQSGWNIPSREVASTANIPGSRSEGDYAAMTSGIQTYPVGLVNGMDVDDLVYTMANRGPANCAATNTCSCPVRATINDPSDVAGLPSVVLSGGPWDGTYRLISNCKGGLGTRLSVQGEKVAIWNSQWGGDQYR